MSARRWIVGTVPVSARGAPQVAKGPRLHDYPRLRWCCWPADAQHPGGLVSETYPRTARYLPRWARRAVRRRAYRAALARLAGGGAP